MDIGQLVEMAMQAGGPTVVAVFAIWVMHKRDTQQADTTKTILECQKENTAALTKLTDSIESQGKATKRLDNVMEEVHTLLIRINGRESKQ